MAHAPSRWNSSAPIRYPDPDVVVLDKRFRRLVVPMAAIDEALADLAAADVHNAVILTSGFAETGHEGADHQTRLASLARQHGVSLLGPNCLGFVNFIDNVPLWTGGFRAPTRPGSIANRHRAAFTPGRMAAANSRMGRASLPL